MIDYPKVYIMLLTYASDPAGPRAQYAQRTLRSTLKKTSYSGQLSVHIADDGSSQEHRDNLYQIAGGFKKVQGITMSNAERRGYGASYNLATQTVHALSTIVLPLEDDWELAHPLNLDRYVAALIQMDPQTPIACLRLGYLGWTQELRGRLEYVANMQFLAFDPDSPERHVCAGHPRLETVWWARRVGLWPEGLDPGTTEHEWCGYANARTYVAWPLDTPAGGYFQHIGTVQAREDQYIAEVS